ncbi:unnamed protein product [Pedinophyceae sp. YPF-701]|nr:unnamed protein product [Pedinophyceae sp. YPF-701]
MPLEGMRAQVRVAESGRGGAAGACGDPGLRGGARAAMAEESARVEAPREELEAAGVMPAARAGESRLALEEVCVLQGELAVATERAEGAEARVKALPTEVHEARMVAAAACAREHGGSA